MLVHLVVMVSTTVSGMNSLIRCLRSIKIEIGVAVSVVIGAYVCILVVIGAYAYAHWL